MAKCIGFDMEKVIDAFYNMEYGDLSFLIKYQIIGIFETIKYMLLR